MQAVLKLAHKLLVNDKARLSGLLISVTFVVSPVIEMTSLFAGVLNRSPSAVYNIGVRVWAMNPAVDTMANSIGMSDYVPDATHSIHGMKLAVPLYLGGAFVYLSSDSYQSVIVAGIDDTSLSGRPRMFNGRIQDLYGEDAFIVIQGAELGRSENPRIGTEFKVNDHRGVAIGIGEVASSGLLGVSVPYTTYHRVAQYLPSTRYTMSYILIGPKTEAGIVAIERAVDWLGYRTLTKEGFIDRISHLYTYQTGSDTNILLVTVINFVVGLSISGRMLYTFILENLEHFGVLKAIGAKGREPVTMIAFQTTFMVLAGHGLGINLYTVLITLMRLRIPDYAAMIIFINLILALTMAIVITGASGYIGVCKILRIESFGILQDWLWPMSLLPLRPLINGLARTKRICVCSCRSVSGPGSARYYSSSDRRTAARSRC